LANDFGEALGCGAYLSSLCRTRIGEFVLEDALTIEAFQQMAREMATEKGETTDVKSETTNNKPQTPHS